MQMIRDMTAQIATAIEEHLVTEEINRHVVVINDAVRHVSGQATEVESSANSAAHPSQAVGGSLAYRVALQTAPVKAPSKGLG
ncbi:hypothetical protein [Stutzerimonas stutzeri]|uniref:hypothetical protein n=1 Tax=Stutzerimonas stutzeri TaxID=316 RepID=UPI00210C1C2E|nr:hypothetical protein [Stutzerimonas stutzeri]MCQ4321651.1 hypothetical protein [Stutzerimonas stutzeri]